MIIQITMIKNEKFLLEKLFPIWMKYADGFIFYDDYSNDGTYEYLIENKKKFNILEIIRGPNRTEMTELTIEKNMRQPLFNAALKFTSKILVLDADEYFDGKMTKSELELIMDQHPNTIFQFKWMQYTSCNTIRVDGPWENNYKVKAGCYTKHMELQNNYLHIIQLPPTEKQIYVDPDKLFVSHLQWLNEDFVAIKQYFWKIYDYVWNKKFAVITAPTSAYDASVNDFNWKEEYFDYPLQIRDDLYEDVSKFDNYRLKFIIDSTEKYNIPNLGDWGKTIINSIPMYYCTVSDEKHFPLLLNLIGSIHKFHFYDTIEIGVYDLGLTEQQKQELNNIKKVKLYNVEKTNPQILDIIETGPERKVRGLFSWKPVVIKQSLEKYPYVVYMDAGTTILKPINNLFKHIKEHGYFLMDCGHSIKWMTTTYIINKLNINPDLLQDDVFGIDAGFIGVSKSHYESFIKPVYELAFDINNFIDDKSCPNGYGCARHDQTLFSIIARKLGLKINYHGKNPKECFLKIKNTNIPFNVVHDPKQVDNTTDIFRSRWNLELNTAKINISNIKRKYILSVVTGIGPLEKYNIFIEKYFKNIQEQILFFKTEHIIVYSEWSPKFDMYKTYPNIIFVKETEQLGVYNAWNIGIINSTSAYITNWNVDDLRHPLNTKLKYDLLNKNGHIDLVYNYYVASKSGETFYNIDLNKPILNFPDDYHTHVTTACMAGPDPMWRKFMHNTVGLFDYKQFLIAGDWDMWIRFARGGYKFKLIPEVMCIYGEHDNTVSKRLTDKLKQENELISSKYKQ